MPCDPPVGLELRLARAARADAASEALQVLPHAAHARQVVLELRDLDLQLPFGTHGVLGEDVEDQLRAVDDTCVERVLEEPLLGRVELAVHEQHVGARLGVCLLQLVELAFADVRSRVGSLTLLHELRDWLDAGGAGKFAQLGELLLGIDAPREHGEHESALLLGTGRRVWLVNLHEPDHATGYPPAMTSLSDRLANRTLELVDVASESRNEAVIRAHVLWLVPDEYSAEFMGDDVFLFAPERRPNVPLVVLAGHYDTVPAQDNLPGRIANGAVHGLGAADMKGGLAVALELVRDFAVEPPAACDVALLVFGREELPARFNPLPALFEGSQLIHETSLAIVLEPTAGAIQAGCVGNMTVRATFHGVSGHSARPWLAQNAIHAAIDGLARIAALSRREVVISDLSFYEVASVTRLEAGIADNVVPDSATATINYRYTPDRTSEEAQAYLRSLLPDGVDVETISDSPPARVVADAPLVRALREAGDLALEPKQAWTNVADFTSRGIDAVNFGPGDPVFAHRRDEQVDVAALVHCYETLHRFFAG